MAFLDVRTRSGDVYELNDMTLIYGEQGISLKLSRNNVASVLVACSGREAIIDRDMKNRRYKVSYNKNEDNFTFEIGSLETVIVKAFDLFQDRYHMT